MSITCNKKRIPLLINCMLAKSVPRILSIKVKYTFTLLNFPIIGLYNFSANLLFQIFSFLIPPPEVFLSKNL